jgi:hypothetical protein
MQHTTRHDTTHEGQVQGYALLEAREGVDEPLEGRSHVVGLGRHCEAPAAGDGHQLLRLLRQQEHIVQPWCKYYARLLLFIIIIIIIIIIMS